MLNKSAKDKNFWKTVANDPRYERQIRMVKNCYANAYEETTPILLFSDRFRYYKDGDRSSFEAPYFRRRTLLSAAAMLALLYPDEEKYIKTVNDLIWGICSEYSWAVPAHTSGKYEDDMTMVDLFAAETGFALSEICNLLEDRLDGHVLYRARINISKRIFDSYENRNYWWEKCTNNWAAVCAGSVGITYMYLDPERFKKVLPRILETMRCFIGGYSDDGVCLEGLSYCQYGLCFYIYFADLLSQFEGKKSELLSGGKIAKIAGYPESCFMKGNTAVSFSDAGLSASITIHLMHYLHRLFPDKMHILLDKYTYLWGGNIPFCGFLRAFTYFDPDAVPVDIPIGDHYSKESGQLIINRSSYSFACKAGTNDEPHNHNDVGSFIISTDAGQQICDMGCGRYTKQYFQPEHRYSFICNNSFGHSVPIINGKGEQAGKNFCGELSYADGIAKLEFADAYGLPELRRLTRVFSFEDKAVRMNDSFDIEPETEVVERFISFIEPKITEDKILIGNVAMYFNRSVCEISVKKEKNTVHGFKNDKNGNPETIDIYCTDLKLISQVNSIDIVFSTE